ncbi:sensor histidine kinase [Dyadobacter frigoris]|uniref:Signal transduction histidine kinase subgroup 3 dimerisation and phosphoacceptor domain-containing protein n=1 Tax=Dyadobacter frigoris TaxID=2576211 RepID=A0A4V6BJD1_9BACT|nr:histidine kinase [Dyadobacter frigoris]TKT92673.1 hypothetical protein FDK13_07620 [Dyadobacter frigoris]
MKNGYVIPVVLSSIVFFLLGIVVATWILVLQKKRLQNSQEEAQSKFAFENEMYRSQAEVQNQTMQRIGRELHDNIGQLLTVAKIHLHLMEDLPAGEEMKNTILEIAEIISKTITEVRQLSQIIDGDLGENFGLVKSLKNELLGIRKLKGYSTELIVADDLPALGFQKEIILFRVTQEALNNAATHHAFSDQLRVFVRGINNQFQFAIESTGVDFDQNALNSISIQIDDAGSSDMKYRIELLGGTLKISSAGKMRRIEIKIPL